MTTVSPAETRAVLDRLRARGIVADLDDPATLADIITGQADAYARACRERDAALARLHAVQQAVWPHLKAHGRVGTLARTINATAAPRANDAA